MVTLRQEADYRRIDETIRAAWLAYKDTVKNTCRPAKSVVDFVAGYNAAKQMTRGCDDKQPT